MFSKGIYLYIYMGFPGGSVVKNLSSKAQYPGLEDPWVGKIPWRRKDQPTPVFLPGKSHEQRVLAGYRLWGHKQVGRNLTTKQEHIIYILFQILFHYRLSRYIYSIGRLLLCNLVLVSAAQQCESAVCLHLSPPAWASLPPPHPSLEVFTEHGADTAAVH